MASWEEVRRIALGLPEAVEQLTRGQLRWSVRGRLFVWERPLRAKEIEALGGRAPQGPIIAARVEHLGAKQALLANDPSIYFTSPHFDRTAAILARLEPLAPDQLEELVTEAWLVRAPPALARAHAARDPRLGGGEPWITGCEGRSPGPAL